MPDDSPSSSSIERLKDIMAKLRDPDSGCPWDVEQNFATIAPYTIEEAYEVADAIERDDMDDLRDELGDLLLQVIFHARMAEEAGHFNFDDVANSISEKMIRRHPHVFGDVSVDSAAAQTLAWEEQKAAERQEKGGSEDISVLDGVAKGLPALLRSYKLQKRAARVGFDWPDPQSAFKKLEEEMGELSEEIDTGTDEAALLDEFADVLFCTVNLARKLDIDPEAALRYGNAKFERRFGYVEAALREQGRAPEDCTLVEMDALWDQGKAEEKKSSDG
jgi:ATP diphosphatase